MKKLILGHFVSISGIPFAAMHFPTDEMKAASKANSTIRERMEEMNKPPGRMLPESCPKRLPTKQHLQNEVAKTWRNKSKNISSLFSRSLAEIGLSGLPEARKYPASKLRTKECMPEKSLNEKASELLEWMRESTP